MSDSTAIEVIPQRSIITRDVLAAAADQRKLIAEYVHSQMKDGHDYGIIPGTNKPTLYKPGAEKLVDLFRVTPKFTLVKAVEDFDRKPPLFSFTFSVTLEQRDSGAILAEGYGSCNSMEDRYRWRKQNPQCPTCSAEALFKSKNDPGFYCWTKKGGCGAKFLPNDAAAKEAMQNAGRVENDDVASLANTLLKMAKKRALVDGAIALARVSDLFSQDTEDMQTPKPKAIWEQVVELAHDYAYDTGGADNKLLWALTAKVTGNKAANRWTADDLKLIEAALAEAVSQKQPDPDIGF